jgi:hypothetical protein
VGERASDETFDLGPVVRTDTWIDRISKVLKTDRSGALTADDLAASSCNQASKSLYPTDNTTAPIKSPKKPMAINPPIAPKNITSMGTEALRPNMTAFMGPSEAVTSTSQIVSKTAGVLAIV